MLKRWKDYLYCARVGVKKLYVRDGFAIKHIIKMGYEVAIITGRDSDIVA